MRQHPLHDVHDRSTTSGRAGRSAQRRRPRAVVAVLAAGCLAASACGSNESDAADGGGSAGGGSEAIAAAVAAVEELREPSNEFVAPGPELDATDLRGEELWYVSLGQAIPVLAVEQNGMKQAAEALGMTLTICDGKFQPAVAAACVNSAVSAGAAGVIMDSVTTASVSTAITNATENEVPVLALAAIGENSEWVAYGTNGDEWSHEGAAQWIVADSDGEARILGTRVQDDTGAIYDIEEGALPVIEACSDCTYDVATYTSGTVPNVPSAVSTALLRNREINYGFPQFDFLVPLFNQGVRTAGMTANMKIVSTNGVLSSMQMVRDGGQDADIASNRNYSGWLAIDAMLRMLKGLEVPAKQDWEIPIRIFDSTNIGDVELTESAAMSGEWFGPLDYQDSFQQLWGLN